ncbi:fibrinogen C domain-containing protein 1-like [Musca autumnalis]|uniref:fibrinogen C domain-containing protein 1-like n=1 Tax=Musca autumnalis TaxID=221902 RepID=UPI003CF08D2B
MNSGIGRFYLIHMILIILYIVDQIKMELISTDFCESEDMDGISQWYTDVYKFIQSNKHLHERLDDFDEKLQRLDEENKSLIRKLEEQQERAYGEIVIQRRIDGSENFYRTWQEYKQGFGNKSREYFIGLERLHKLTNSRPYELLVVVEDFENVRRFAKYDNFVVASESEKYKLQSLGNYSGTAGDSLLYHLGCNFTTKDQDNDAHNNNCAQLSTGAWWYKNCHGSNLNGSYLNGTTTIYAKGVIWNSFRGHYYLLKFAEMSIRPK